MCLIYIVLLHNIKQSFWYNTIVAYPVGMFYSIYRGKIEQVVQKNNIVYISILIGTLLCALMSFHYQANFICYEILVVCFIAMICLVSMKISVKNGILLWLGKYTFEIYILQRLPMIMLQNSILNKYTFFMVCLATTFVIAVLYRKLTDYLDGKMLYDRNSQT
jgi:peptidoglycan/LPS O-acetylase OafA/YrhL